jgi:hypothetical protein
MLQVAGALPDIEIVLDMFGGQPGDVLIFGRGQAALQTFCVLDYAAAFRFDPL